MVLIENPCTIHFKEKKNFFILFFKILFSRLLNFLADIEKPID